MGIKKQIENGNELLQLIKDNPNLPILPFVATECCFDDSYNYWMAEWGKSRVSKYYVSNEMVYSYEDYETLVEKWIDDNYEDYPDLSDEELQKKAEEIVNSYEWIDAILVWINSI